MTLVVSPRPLDGAAWRSTSGNLDGRWLQVMGDRPPGELVYFTLYTRDGAEIACTTGYVITDPHCYDAFNWHALLWSPEGVFPEQPPCAAASPPPAEDCFPMLALVQPGYDFAVHTIGSTDDRCVEELLAAVETWAADHGLVSIVALYAGDELQEPLGRLGWRRFRGADRAVASLAGRTSYEDLWASLSRNARKQLRSDYRVLAANAVTVAHARVSEHVDVLLQLRSQLVEKYGSYVDRSADAKRLTRLLATYGDHDLRLFLAHAGPTATAVGFALFVVTGERSWSAFWVGSDRSDPRSDRVYFGCLFYAPMISALKSGVTTIDYGLGTDEAKLRRGCRSLARDVFVSPAARLDDAPSRLAIARPMS